MLAPSDVRPARFSNRLRGLVAAILTFSFAALALSILIFPLVLKAQDSEMPTSTFGKLAGKLRVSVSLVLVPVRVIDAKNRPVTDLKPDAFALYQDDERQEIQYFGTEDSPISVGLLLDLSKSMSNKFAAERAAVSEFFKNANAQDDYFVITFSDHPRLVTTSAQSIDTIESSLALLKPDGNTALLDAVWDGAGRMGSAQYRRRVLLIISDGGDNHSRHSLRRLRKDLEESDVQVYAIGIFDVGPFKSVEEAMGRRWLSQITDATGGRTVAVTSIADLPAAAARISREMREQYVLGYRPELSYSGRRKIKVRVTPAEGSMPLHAYYKTGYEARLDTHP